MKEYRIARGWEIFVYVAGGLMIVPMGWLVVFPFKDGNFEPNSSWILIPISLGMIVAMGIGMVDAYRGKLIIGPDRVTSIGALQKRELTFAEIKGYTANDQYIFIEPKAEGQKRIKVSKYLKGRDEVVGWLAARYPDLDEQQIVDEEQSILTDENLGSTPELRAEKLLKAKKTAKIINWVGGIVAAWTIFYPSPYQLSLLAALLVPLVALAATKLSNGLIRINEQKNSAYPSVFFGFLFPSFGLIMRAFSDYDIYDYSNLWTITAVVAVALVVLWLVGQREFGFKTASDYILVLSLGLFMCMYSFGAVVHINCFYDHSPSVHYTAKVLDKRINQGKSTTYYLNLSPWGPKHEADEVSVGKRLYHKLDVGEEVNIYFNTGKLNIPWFEVTE